MRSIFANNIKALCELYGLSHNDLAKKSGLRQSVVSRVINGTSTPREPTIQALSRALHADPWLMRTQSVVNEATGVIDVKGVGVKEADNAVLGKGHIEEAPSGQVNRAQEGVTPELLLDPDRLKDLWHYVVAQAQEGGTPYVSMVMPTDDLSPVVPRGATLYLTVEEDPQHPLLGDCEYAVGITTFPANSSRVLVFGTPTFSLGQLTLKTCRGQTVTVTGVVAYVIGWTVFKPRGLVSSKHAW